MSHHLYAWQETIALSSKGDMHGSHMVNVLSTLVHMFCVYVDATVFLESGQTSYGVVIKDNHGEYVAAKSDPVCCLNDVNLAEAIAIKEALSWVKEGG